VTTEPRAAEVAAVPRGRPPVERATMSFAKRYRHRWV
jgi:hypothetical protein